MEITYSGGARTVWLTSPSEIEAHLVFLAVEVGSVSLTLGQQVCQGRVLAPSIARLVPFEPDPIYGDILACPSSQMPVRLDYQAWDDSYSFHTRVVGVDAAGRWLLFPPRAVERADRRIVHRHMVLGDPSFRVFLEGPWLARELQPFAVYDISTDGVAFLYDPEWTPLASGDLLSGRLRIADRLDLPVLLRVAHTRRVPEAGSGWVAGARYLDLNLENRLELTRTVTAWEMRNRSPAPSPTAPGGA